MRAMQVGITCIWALTCESHCFLPFSHHAGRLAEDRANCELIAKEEIAVQQLVLMALSENPMVVVQACKTIGGVRRVAAATLQHTP